MITPTQMRAARAMLDVSQGHVAQYLGIAANTLSKIESGQSDVSGTRLADIQRFYEREGVEFTANDGVQWKTGGVETYKGRSGFLDFIDDVYETVKINGGEIFVDNVDEDQFNKWAGEDTDKLIARFASVPNLQSKILVEEGAKNLVNSTYTKYRSVPQNKMGQVPLYMYGEKTALIVFTKDDVEIFIINHASITRFFRGRFEMKWEDAEEI